MHCLYGGYNLHRFSDALGLVSSHNGHSLFHKTKVMMGQTQSLEVQLGQPEG